MSFRKLCAAAASAAFSLTAGAALAAMEALEGTIESVDAEAGDITVELDNGKTATFAVGEETQIDIYGNIGRGIDELHAGQHVQLELEETADQRVTVYVIRVSDA